MRICSVDGCGRKHYAKGYCNSHYMQYLRVGTITNIKPLREPNNVIFDGDICKIEVKNKKGIFFALVDSEDYDRVKQYKWHMDSCRGYIITISKGRRIFLHHMIFGEKTQLDHINRNNIDNRKCNLRKCNTFQNMANRTKQKNNTSGFKGISWEKHCNKWRARIYVDGKNKNIGLFKCKIEAAKAYNKAALAYKDNEFVYLNPIPEAI